MAQSNGQKVELNSFLKVFLTTWAITLILAIAAYFLADMLDAFPSDLEVDGLGEFTVINVFSMTMIGNVGAAFVFIILSKIKADFINIFYILSGIIFAVYFILPFQGLVNSSDSAIIALQIMHVLVAGPIIYFYRKYYNR